MPQLYTKEKETLYKKILSWIQQDFIPIHPTTTILMGGDLQATPWEGDTRSHYAPLRRLHEESGLEHFSRNNIHTFIPTKTPLDH
jgi:hypothetical protein